jgi:hypothetical protein
MGRDFSHQEEQKLPQKYKNGEILMISSFIGNPFLMVTGYIFANEIFLEKFSQNISSVLGLVPVPDDNRSIVKLTFVRFGHCWDPTRWSHWSPHILHIPDVN